MSPGPWQPLIAAFRKGLEELGYVEGRNVTIEYRWAEGQYGRLPALAAELAMRQVAVIVATGGGPSALAAKAATVTIPIVFAGAGDPVALGLVNSLAKPGGNATGLHLFVVGLEPKRLELLRELVPDAPLIAVLLNPDNPEGAAQRRGIEEAAHSTGQRITVLAARSEAEIDAAFAAMSEQRANAVLVGADPFFNSRREQLVALAERHRIPASYELREFVAAGGLMSYGNSLSALYRHIGLYTARVLNGEHPGEIPVLRPDTFELVMNLKTARALGLSIAPALLARADEVIE
ncbi:MAG TPA: ABC transporter substrate-binding protein [Alphaproteobacteria bacterium]|nr:ABC transporter substrate-binding protein [Alphaproteobacteria bacterium]